MIASAPPTSPAEAPVRCVLRLSGEKTHSKRANILGGERGTFLVKSESKNSSSTLFSITDYWLVITFQWCEYKLLKIQVKHTFLKGAWYRWTFSTTPEWICMKYFRFGVIVVTDRVDSKSRGTGRRREELCKNSRWHSLPRLIVSHPNATAST